MQIETITFGQAEIRSVDDPRTIRHSSADDLPLIRKGFYGTPTVKITCGNLAKFEVGTFEDDLVFVVPPATSAAPSDGMGLLGGTGSGKYTLYTLLHGLLKPLKRGLNFGDRSVSEEEEGLRKM
ncbi:hypothetical protein B0H13DRAFT_1882998 [Mycena leptocephala]|nr:hypothetical protein B0H13DRAFT_1882998 [Mycena leptocephala]